MRETTPTEDLSASDPTRLYDRVTEAWRYLLGDDLHYGYFSTGSVSLQEATQQLTNEMLALANLDHHQQVLDIGCGTGNAACRISKELQCQVYGISPSTTCITNARERARVQQSPKADFFLGDGTQLAFTDNSVDCTWVMESSHLMQNKEALISECSRVMKPGGRLVLCDIMLNRKLAIEEVIEHRDEFLLLKDVFGRAIMEPLDFYNEQLKNNGLIVNDSRSITQETRPTFEHWRNNAKKNHRQVCQLIGETACAQFIESCNVLENFWDAGIMGYGIISATKPA